MAVHFQKSTTQTNTIFQKSRYRFQGEGVVLLRGPPPPLKIDFYMRARTFQRSRTHIKVGKSLFPLFRETPCIYIYIYVYIFCNKRDQDPNFYFGWIRICKKVTMNQTQFESQNYVI